MSVQHQDFLELATEMIGEEGRIVYLVERSNTGSSFDPSYTETETPVKALQTDFSMSEVDGTMVRSDDKKFLIDGIVPIGNAMRIRDKGSDSPDSDIEDYSIVYINQLKPGNTVILYEVYARV